MFINKNNDYKNIFNFRFSDIFNINILNKTYIQITNYLNNKYNNNSQKIIKSNTNIKKIKIYSVDLFNKKNFLRWIKSKLKDSFIIKFDSNNPDYLIFNIFGKEHLNKKYKNSVKIAIYTENKIPDFNYADYALGHAHINYLDRYFKYSIFLWKDYQKINKVREKVLSMPIRSKFCAALITNSKSSDKFRLYFINELSKYKKIDMGGNYKNNIGGRIQNKLEFLSSYKFSIAMENSNGDGYISEKIIDSFNSGTIPIYYGDYMIDEFINPKSYILVKGIKDIKEKINYIKKIDNNDELYKKILKEKVIIKDNFQNIIDKELKLFLKNIFYQNKKKAYRIDNKIYNT